MKQITNISTRLALAQASPLRLALVGFYLHCLPTNAKPVLGTVIFLG
jgi:hypothetical protein